MADLTEIPAGEVAPDDLPRSGDRYRAYACWEDYRPLMIAFVFPDWSITPMPYANLQRQRFKPLGEPWDSRGPCVIVLTFGGPRDGTDVVLVGSNLYPLVADLSEHRVNWIWESPQCLPAVADGSPVVRSIELRKRSALA